MPVLVDPKTGQQYDYEGLEGDLEADQKTFGLVSPGEYEARKAWEAKSIGEQAQETALAGAKGLLRGGMSLGQIADSAATGASAPERFEQNFPGQEDPLYGAGAQALAEQHPLATGVGQSLPFMVAGGAGGLGWGMAAGAGVEGVSQEAVDSVMQKRGFSATTALMNGGINLAMGAVGHAGGKVLGSVFGAGEDAAKAGAREVAPSRNWVAEIDPGEVPEALGRRPAQSAGAAAAANREYGSAARQAVPDAPVHLEGKSLEDLGALPIEDAADRARVEALKANEQFAETGRVASNDGAQGIIQRRRSALHR
jgi:hypothetical protein